MLGAVSFEKWEFAALVAVLVVAGAILAASLIGRALRWLGVIEDAKKRRGG